VQRPTLAARRLKARLLTLRQRVQSVSPAVERWVEGPQYRRERVLQADVSQAKKQRQWNVEAK